MTSTSPAVRLRSVALAGACLVGPTLAQGGLAPAGTYPIAESVIDNYVTVDGVVVDVKVYRPVGLPPGDAPVVLYSPGGGTGTGGTISGVPQHDVLWRLLVGAGMTVVFLQNELETSPGHNFWQLRGDIVMWAIANSAQLNASFGTQLGPQSPTVVIGWSLGAVTGVQHVGADFGFGNYSDARIRGAVLFASPAIGAYNGVITSSGLAQVNKPALCIFGSDDMGQPGTYVPGSPPAQSPRGLGVQAMLGGPSRLVLAACYQDANHFEYGAQPTTSGSANAQRVAHINAQVFAFVDLLLRGLPDCGVFATPSWANPALVSWSTQRCTPPIVRVLRTGCATSTGVPDIGTSGGEPVAGNASFALTLGSAPAGAPCISGLQLGAPPAAVGVSIPGAPACASLFLQPDLFWFGTASTGGTATIGLPLPAGPSLWGFPVSAQHAVFDFAFPGFAGMPLPFGTSRALWIGIGN